MTGEIPVGCELTVDPLDDDDSVEVKELALLGTLHGLSKKSVKVASHYRWTKVNPKGRVT